MIFDVMHVLYFIILPKAGTMSGCCRMRASHSPAARRYSVSVGVRLSPRSASTPGAVVTV